METNDLQLWYAYPRDLVDESAAKACAGLLSDEEQQHWQRFRHETNRRESLTSRALARIALSHAHPFPPQDWDFAVNAYGKPHPVPECGLRFNLSNSDELVVCLVAHGAEVGVDVEPYQRGAQILRLAESVFSPVEKGQISTLAGEEQQDRALSLWTLKEAYIKARGMGLSLPLKSISFVFGDDAGIDMELDPELEDDSANWKFCLLNHAEHRIAIMVEQSCTSSLSVQQVRPPLAAPVNVQATVLGWFPW
jgi:4'-phosphopantetheinyl transferase